MVCFIPTTSLTSASLLHHFNMVLNKLQAIGFHVNLVLADGHKTNIKFFSELGKGCLELFIQNSGPESAFFTMFDPVHIFKNFYHNFQRTKYEHFVWAQYWLLLKQLEVNELGLMFKFIRYFLTFRPEIFWAQVQSHFWALHNSSLDFAVLGLNLRLHLYFGLSSHINSFRIFWLFELQSGIVWAGAHLWAPQFCGALAQFRELIWSLFQLSKALE